MSDVPTPGTSLSAAASDPTDAADDLADAAEQHAAAEGADATDAKPSIKLREMLFSTGPEEPLESIESPWNPERGGPRRILRGVRKMGEFEGMPAIVDVLIGLAETIVQMQNEMEKRNARDDDADDDQADDDDGANLPVLAGAGGV